jgi:beta-xylosidase
MTKKLFTIVAIVLVASMALSACAPAATPEPVTEPTAVPVQPTAAPVVEPTAVPPTDVPPTEMPPTATMEPSPTPDPLLFRDDFEGSLGDGWQWIRENPKYWSLTKNPGWLEIMAGAGAVRSGDIKNLLLRPVPDGNFQLETKLQFKPTGKYQIAGLLIYESAAEHLQFGRAYCASSQCSGDGFYFDKIVDGNFSPENFASSAPEVEVVFLRLVREGDKFSAFVSVDGNKWNLIGVHKDSLEPLYIGLISGQAYNSVPKTAQFDYFTITSLP